ncbi:capsule assembly Wzi family protein [Salinimicrobium sp. TH3]|uniref:capsule assembly Wzi family protein n=1 Tax=Salinimicrobium sp. TH3 TaxID=2997342 RepID=UPI002275F035|nr:capsule assembly Wzi family protein [Salinimicrobium sp. TH3]MCY2687781.1 hypothetical protein [Salinimicrobium sp. TH3]
MIQRSSLILLLLVFNAEVVFCQLSASELKLIAPSLGYVDDFNYSLEWDLRAMSSTQTKLPFWMHHNTYGLLAGDSQISTNISGRTSTFLTYDSQLFFGGGINYHDGTGSGVHIAELYMHFNNPWIYLTLGKKNRLLYYNGLSASNENILWSSNAPPLPGLQLGTKKLLFPVERFSLGFQGAWEEYWFGNDGYVQETRLHHKFFRVILNKENWELSAGVRHFAQWGGKSPKTGQQPNDLGNYLKVLAGKEGLTDTENGPKIIANHLGSYELIFTRSFFDFSLQFFYNSIFDDLSGRRMENFPDGRYGLYFTARDNDNIVNSVLYEFYYTMHQSKNSQGFHKHDNYLNNGTYQSGWTYRNKVLGTPFFTLDDNSAGIISNRFIAHHLGIEGILGDYYQTFPYKLLLSYAENHGRYNKPFQEKQDVFYGLLELQLFQNLFDIHLQTGVEFNSQSAPVYGAGVSLKYKFSGN